MGIPNKIILTEGSSVGKAQLEQLQTNFSAWVADHHHVNASIPILTLVSDTKISAAIAADDFLYAFTNQVVNTDISFIDYDIDYLVLNLSKLSDLYNKSVLLGQESYQLKNLIYSYADSYFIDSDGNYNLVFKNPTFTEENLDVFAAIPQLTSFGVFSFSSATLSVSTEITQKEQTIQINKELIADWTYVAAENLLIIEVNDLINAFIGIPALRLNPSNIVSSDQKTALQHIQDSTKHASAFATEVGPMETPKFNMFATPDIKKSHPLFVEGKFIITSNDKLLTLNVIKDESKRNDTAAAKATDMPMDSMFRGNSRNPTWLRESYFSGEQRQDAVVLKEMIEDNYNYEIESNDAGFRTQTYAKTTTVPAGTTSFIPATMYNANAGEARAVKLKKQVTINTQTGETLARLPLIVRMAPNRQEDSYMYGFLSGRKSHTMNKSLLGGFRGQTMYAPYKANIYYNISPDLHYEKMLTLGSPYECFNLGAEHLYRVTIQKNYSNPDADFDGYYFDEKSIQQIKQDEIRML